MTPENNGLDKSSPYKHPVRLVVPRLYFWKSAKWVLGVEFMIIDGFSFLEMLKYKFRTRN